MMEIDHELAPDIAGMQDEFISFHQMSSSSLSTDASSSMTLEDSVDAELYAEMTQMSESEEAFDDLPFMSKVCYFSTFNNKVLFIKLVSVLMLT